MGSPLGSFHLFPTTCLFLLRSSFVIAQWLEIVLQYIMLVQVCKLLNMIHIVS